MWTKLNRLAASAAVAFTLTACAGGKSAQNGPLPPDGKTSSVEVRNNNWADMTVYLERNGTKQRLGTVTSMAKRRFKIPGSFLTNSGSVRLMADPIGSAERHVSSPVQVWPGQTVAFTIENHLAISSVLVR